MNLRSVNICQHVAGEEMWDVGKNRDEKYEEEWDFNIFQLDFPWFSHQLERP